MRSVLSDLSLVIVSLFIIDSFFRNFFSEKPFSTKPGIHSKVLNQRSANPPRRLKQKILRTMTARTAARIWARKATFAERRREVYELQ
jgi:hypothetical protein